MSPKSRIASIFAAASFIVGVAGVSHAKKAKEFVVVPAGTAKFVPFIPQDPEHSPLVAVLHGDPKTGPVAFLLKTKGPAPIHYHTSDYYALVVSGVARHWENGKDSEKQDLQPGSFWFQPGGDKKTAHGDECVTPEGCTIYIFMPNKQDLIPLDAKSAQR
jgi:quercetin dioxygenase-like cupin family protein